MEMVSWTAHTSIQFSTSKGRRLTAGVIVVFGFGQVRAAFHRGLRFLNVRMDSIDERRLRGGKVDVIAGGDRRSEVGRDEPSANRSH